MTELYTDKAINRVISSMYSKCSIKINLLQLQLQVKITSLSESLHGGFNSSYPCIELFEEDKIMG
jgi:hypothetical protein